MSVRRTITICAEVLVLITLATPQVHTQSETIALRGRDAISQIPSSDSTRARQSPHDARSRITLDLHQAPLKDALRAIATQAKVVLFYNDGDIAAQPRVSISVTTVSIDSALGLVLRHTSLTTRVTNAGIVVEREKAPKSEARPRAQDGSIHGRVHDAKTGQGIDGVTVAVDGTRIQVTTGNSGDYRISRIPAGRYSVRAKRLGYEPATKSVAVVADEETVVNFALQPATTILNQVVVTGTVVPTEVKALPTPITVITAQQIAQQHALTFAAILRQAVPTAVAPDPPNTPANSDVSVRGASSLTGPGDMKIFIDGVEATSFGNSVVDPASIARIEVVRGPEAATLYGADAAGGVIQIFTKRGDSTATQPQVDVRAALGLSQTPYDGYKNVLRQEYTAAVHGGGEAASYRLGGSYRQLADYVPGGATSRQNTPGAYGGVNFTHGIVNADVSARYEHNTIPSTFNPELSFTGYVPYSRPLYLRGDLTNETYGARLTTTPAGWLRNQVTLGVDRLTVDNTQTQPRRTTPGDTLLFLQRQNSRKLSVGFNTTAVGPLSRSVSGSITLGLDHYVQNVSSFSTSQALNTSGTIQIAPNGSLDVNDNSITNTGYFSQAQLSIHDALFFTLGARAEDNSAFGTDYGTAVLPRMGVSLVRPVGGITVKVRASYGKALRAPGATASVGFKSGSSIQLANPNLAPERQDGWDGGVDLVFGTRGSLSVTGFDQTARDLIAFLEVSSTPLPTYEFQNVGKVSNRGIEVEASFTPASWLALKAQYGHVHSRIIAIGAAGGQVQVGDEPVGVPANTAGASLTATPHSGTSLTIGLTYVGRLHNTDTLGELRCLATFSQEACPASFLATFSTRDFIVSYPGFAKVNASVAHRFSRRVEGFLSVDNLTNNEAFEFYNASPVIGRTTMLGVGLTY